MARNTLTGLIVFGVAFGLVVPWRMFLESLRADNPQLSTSFFVTLLPVWLGLFVFGIVKRKKDKSSDN